MRQSEMKRAPSPGGWLIAVAAGLVAAAVAYVVGHFHFTPSAFIGLLVFLVVGFILGMYWGPQVDVTPKPTSVPEPKPATVAEPAAAAPAVTAPAMAAPVAVAPAPVAAAPAAAAPAATSVSGPAAMFTSTPPASAAPAKPAREAKPKAAPVAKPVAAKAAAKPAAVKAEAKPAAAKPAPKPAAVMAEQKPAAAKPAARAAAKPAVTKAPKAPKAAKPAGPVRLTAPRKGKADDLKEIEGIGPALEKLCNSMGFYHFDQIATWSDADVAMVDAEMKTFKGRIARDKWVAQAKLIVAEGLEAFRIRAKTNNY
jgi:predicted flap endonuclease-1-like 5' DNA nuclease